MAIWKAKRTLLLVGEGAHEEAFLTHVKALYVTRGSGLHVRIKNARGKGAHHVVQWTARQLANVAYDQCAALLDTDTNFTQETIKLARIKKIQLLTSEPCLEAMLLRLLGEPPSNKSLKKQILPFVNGDATKASNYNQYFTRELLEKQRINEPTIHLLLTIVSTGVQIVPQLRSNNEYF